MTKRDATRRIVAVVARAIWAVIVVLAHFAWRAFGLFLFVVGIGAVGGAIASDVWTGITTIWTGGVVLAVGYIGYKIVTTGRATIEDVAIAMRKGLEQIQSQSKK